MRILQHENSWNIAAKAVVKQSFLAVVVLVAINQYV